MYLSAYIHRMDKKRERKTIVTHKNLLLGFVLCVNAALKDLATAISSKNSQQARKQQMVEQTTAAISHHLIQTNKYG